MFQRLFKESSRIPTGTTRCSVSSRRSWRSTARRRRSRLIERRRARRIDLLPLTVDYDTTLEDQVEEADVRSNYDISDKAYPASRQGRTGHETVSLVLRRMLAAEAPNARCVRNGLKDTWSSSMPNLVALIPTNERCEISELVALAQYWRQLRDGRIMFVACVGEHSWCATDGVPCLEITKTGAQIILEGWQHWGDAWILCRKPN